MAVALVHKSFLWRDDIGDRSQTHLSYEKKRELRKWGTENVSYVIWWLNHGC